MCIVGSDGHVVKDQLCELLPGSRSQIARVVTRFAVGDAVFSVEASYETRQVVNPS